MRKTQLKWLRVGLIWIVILDLIVFHTDIYTEKVVIRLCIKIIHLTYLMLLVAPLLFGLVLRENKFRDAICAIFSAIFIYSFWINLIMIIIPMKSMRIAILVNAILIALWILILIINIYLWIKPKYGYVNKREKRNIDKAIILLQNARPMVTGNDLDEIQRMISVMEELVQSKIMIAHDIDSSIVQESQEILNGALLQNAKSISLHIAVLNQLLNMSTNVESAEKR